MRPQMAVLLSGLLALAACGASEPTRFYLLSPEQAASSVALAGPVVFVDQATVAPYLDRAQLVSRVAPDQVAFSDVRTWAEPPTSMITRYLVDELGNRFGPARVLETPARRDLAPDFRLAIDVQRFDGDQAGRMVLDARWTLLAGSDERFVATGRERIAEPAADPASWDARVAALGRALAVLGGRLGDAIAARAAAS
ncbi:MAG: PqiC family protein [Geminicoccaceae bacterium]